MPSVSSRKSLPAGERLQIPQLIGLPELSRLMSVDPRTIKAWAHSGKMPTPMRLGTRSLWRWKKQEIQDWLSRSEESK